MARPRLSLRWQVLAGLLAVLAAVLAISHQLAWRSLTAELERRNVAQVERQHRTFTILIQQLAERLTLEAEALVVPFEQDEGPIQRVADNLDLGWSHQALLLDLAGGVLFDSDGRLVRQWGDIHLPLPAGWGELLQPDKGPFSRLSCHQDCRQYVGVPLAVASGGALVLASPLTELVVTLRQMHEADVALLVRDPNAAPAATWPLRAISLSQPELNQPLLAELVKRVDFHRLIAGPELFDLDRRHFRLSLLPLDGEGANANGYLLLIQDESKTLAALEALARKQALATGVVVTLALILAGTFAVWLTSRLGRLAEALPLLATQHFDEARHKLAHRRHWWRDELSDLERAARKVTEQLAGLADEVELRTAALERMALNDELTGLPNRIGLQRALTSLLSQQPSQRVVVILIDLDHFKRVNDTLGYAAGDELLLTIAHRLEQLVADVHHLARFGGDELVLVASGLDDTAIDNLLRAIHLSIRQPVNVARQALVLQASMGVALADSGFDAPQPEVLLRQAEAAMFSAKERGRGHWCRFDPEMISALHADLSIEQALRLALREQQFVLHVQPQIALASRRLIGFEVLIRWRHPERGLIYPDAFIDALEQSEQIVPVGYWTIDYTLGLLARLEAGGYPGLKMAVNLCSRQFLDATLADFIAERLRHHGISGKQLELELTENTLIGDFDLVMARIESLRALGISLAIDDFGSGYSSLNYLRRLPVDLLKIDREFVMELHLNDRDQNLVKTILDLARNLAVEVVAEGVEQLEHVEFLAANGCQFGQGYVISRPFPSADLLAVLGRHVHNGVWQL